MKFNPQKHHRRTIRLPLYDYSTDGAYFITLCAHERFNLFGKIEDGEMILNKYGVIVEGCWHDLPKHYGNIVLDEYVVMPDHFHGIIIVDNDGFVDSGVGCGHGVVVDGIVGAGLKPAPTTTAMFLADMKIKKRHGLPEFVRAFKTFSMRRINQMRDLPGAPVWQRNYYEHIIRNKHALRNIRQYIRNNPLKWDYDRNHPQDFRRAGFKPTPRVL